MQKVIKKTPNSVLTFSYVKNSPFYEGKVCYGFFFSNTRTLNFTSTTFIINFSKTVIKVELKHILKP